MSNVERYRELMNQLRESRRTPSFKTAENDRTTLATRKTPPTEPGLYIMSSRGALQAVTLVMREIDSGSHIINAHGFNDSKLHIDLGPDQRPRYKEVFATTADWWAGPITIEDP